MRSFTVPHKSSFLQHSATEMSFLNAETFAEKDTKAQRNGIICQLSQKKSQYTKQADSRNVLNTNIHDL